MIGLNIDRETVLHNFDFDITKSKLLSAVSQSICSTRGSQNLQKPCPTIPFEFVYQNRLESYNFLFNEVDNDVS